MKIVWIARTKYQKLIARFAASSGSKLDSRSVCKARVDDDYTDADVVISFGDTPVNLEDGQTWLHADGAYFGRPYYFRISKNAFYPWDYMMDITRPGDRWNKLGIDVHPYRDNGDQAPILVCKLSERNAAFLGSDMKADIEDMKRIVARQTDRKIIIREKNDRFNKPFKAVVRNAYAVITWWSTTGVEALVAGVPIFLLSRSVCESLAGSLFRINEPRRPNRTQWMHNLAYQQWNRDEIVDGTAWKFYMEGDLCG